MNIRVVCLAVVMAFVTAPVCAQSLSAAKSRVAQANEAINAERFDDIDGLLTAAEKFLVGLPDAEKAPVLADIAGVRTKVGAAIKARDGRRLKSQFDRELTQAEDNIRQQPELAETQLKAFEAKLGSADTAKALDASEIAAYTARIAGIRAKVGESPAKPTGGNLGAAKSRVTQAKNLLESRRFENIEYYLEEAMGFLKGCSEAERAPVLADMTVVRTALAEGLKAEETRIFKGFIEQHLTQASSNIASHTYEVAGFLKVITERLDTPNAARLLTTEEMAAYRARHAEITIALAAHRKAMALAAAQRYIDELEEMLRSDPYAGKEGMEAYKAARDIEAAQRAAKNNLEGVPKDDDVRAIENSLAALKKKADAASSSWSTAQVEASLREGWKFAMSDSTGWEEEKPAEDKKPNEQWGMWKTVAALRGAAYWLADEQILKMKADQPGSAIVKEIFTNAEKTRDGAAAKLDAAFNAAMVAAEKMPLPRNRFDITIASWMALDAEEVFKGTKYHKANVERAKALDARWERELEALRKAAAERLKKLTDEANKAWPGILKDVNPDDDFEAKSLARSRGDRVLLKDVYNRSGWDFDAGQYDFATRIDGVAIAGTYASWVDEAIMAIWEKNEGPPLSDRETWDVIVEVEGRGMIRRRVTTTLIAADTREVIGKMEGHEPEEGVIVRVIGLRAGPVAVGRR